MRAKIQKFEISSQHYEEMNFCTLLTLFMADVFKSKRSYYFFEQIQFSIFIFRVSKIFVLNFHNSLVYLFCYVQKTFTSSINWNFSK